MKALSFGLLGFALMCQPFATAAEGPQAGDPAPEFQAQDDTGKTWKSTDHVGKEIVVVYFYPADMTGGCTKQACGFRDDAASLKEAGVTVVGVSGDSVRNHQLFKKVYDLNFLLLADESGAVAKKFGVATKDGGTITREIEGVQQELTRGVTAARTTFVIGKDGKIALRKDKVNAAQDSQEILAIVETLK